MLLPFVHAAAHEPGADLEGVADALEREQHAAVLRLEPCARVLEELAGGGCPRSRVALIARDGVLEDREHEEALALSGALAAHGGVELAGEDDLRHATAARRRRRGGSRLDVELDHAASPLPVCRTSSMVHAFAPARGAPGSCRAAEAAAMPTGRRSPDDPPPRHAGHAPPRGHVRRATVRP